MTPLVVGVDGPAASGKTTLARRIAGRFGLPFLDTGLLYRGVARGLIEAGQDFDDVAAAVAIARALEPADLDPDRLAREDVGAGASRVAALGEVRAALLDLQRRFGDDAGAVLAGRDIGTVVRPDASRKVFVTASAEERARRRFEELRSAGGTAIYAQVLQQMRERDARDRSRAVAPLVPAEDAFVIDTTNHDLAAAFAAIEAFVARGRS